MIRALLLVTLAAGAGAVTSKNWESHPTVEASRAVFTEVTKAIDAKSWVPYERPDCEQEFSSLAIATDGQGVARYLKIVEGGSDSVQTVEHFYDAKGRVRFVFGRSGAVPAAWVQARWWIDEFGAVAWTRRASGGDGPTYYLHELKDVLVTAPRETFAKRTTCP